MFESSSRDANSFRPLAAWSPALDNRGDDLLAARPGFLAAVIRAFVEQG